MEKEVEHLIDEFMELMVAVAEGHEQLPVKKELEAKILSLYEKIVARYRPLIQAAPAVVDKVGKDIVPILVSFMKLANVTLDDAGLEKEMVRLRKYKAKSRMDGLKTYQEAGFTRAEAMTLVLQDAGAPSPLLTAIQTVGKSVPQRKAAPPPAPPRFGR